MRRRLVRISILAFVFSASGCATRERIPRFPLEAPDATLRDVRAKAASVRSISAEGSMRLEGADGQSVGLDVAIAMRLPGEARVRAWKFTQAVFDLTVNPQGVYLVAPGDSAHAEQVHSAGATSGRLVRQWIDLVAGQSRAAEGISFLDNGNALILREDQRDGTTLVTTIDRPTRTTRRYAIEDADGKERFSLALEQFCVVDSDHVWPRRIVARSESGTIRIDLREIEINDEISDAAFRPPARAEKLP